VNYIVRNRSEDERASFIRPFQEAFKTADGDKSVEEDEERRKAVFSMVLTEVGGLGDGSEKGQLLTHSNHAEPIVTFRSEIEGFFNLLYAHLFALYPADAPETRQRLQTLLQVVAASPSENVAIKYRMYAPLAVIAFASRLKPVSLASRTYLMPYHENVHFEYLYSRPYSSSPELMTNWICCKCPGRMLESGSQNGTYLQRRSGPCTEASWVLTRRRECRTLHPSRAQSASTSDASPKEIHRTNTRYLTPAPCPSLRRALAPRPST
jgi:hypothetical protein